MKLLIKATMQFRLVCQLLLSLIAVILRPCANLQFLPSTSVYSIL